MVGDEINAQICFAAGVHATYTTRRRQREVSGSNISFVLTGSAGVARLVWGLPPTVELLQQDGGALRWRPIPGDPTQPTSGAVDADGRDEESMGAATARLVEDWLAAIDDGREPSASAANGAKAVELTSAVFAAGMRRARVTIPLEDRRHPLAAYVGV